MTDQESGWKIVVGLGNPGAKYTGTRHNVGFEVIDYLSKQLNASLPNGKFEGEVATASVNDQRILLVRPLTFMNLSGRCVAAAANFYKVNVEHDLLVICDDLSLPVGKLRVRAKGSAGGQNGLKDILRATGTQNVARLRVGIDPAPPRWDAADYVLGKFTEEQREIINEAVKTASDAAVDWCTHGVQHCMNQFN